jgi:predicted nucleic acid-binding protein
MITRILDTSVAIAWYLPEVFSVSARLWNEKFRREDVRFIVPPLHALEFSNVLRSYTRRGEIDAGLASDIYKIHLESPLYWEEPSRNTILDVAFKYETTTYDASYISLALAHKVPVLTAEKTTTPWVVKLGRLADLVR